MSAPIKMINYETPLGTFASWEEAAAACERADLDPLTCIKNVPIEFRDVCVEHAYGSPLRISRAIRVFGGE
jgi:hypothetical protein